MTLMGGARGKNSLSQAPHSPKNLWSANCKCLPKSLRGLSQQLRTTGLQQSLTPLDFWRLAKDFVGCSVGCLLTRIQSITKIQGVKIRTKSRNGETASSVTLKSTVIIFPPCQCNMLPCVPRVDWLKKKGVMLVMCSALRGMLRHCMQVNECLRSWQQPHFLREFVVQTAKEKKRKNKKGKIC